MKDNLQTAFSTRQYMISVDFELYYYRDRSLSRVESHRHDYYEFYFFLEGDVSICIEHTTFPLHPGDIILIPPGVSHHAVIHTKDRCYGRFVFWISTAYYQRLTAQSSDYSYLIRHISDTGKYILHTDSILFNSIQSRLFQIIEEMHGDRFGKETKLSLCIGDLLLHLSRIVYEQEHPGKAADRGTLYCSLVQYIDSHLSDNLTLDSLAAAFFISKYHIAHVFKKNIGMSVCQYITKKRLQACREAICGSTELTEVCLQFGFQDYSTFFRAFKKEYGVSPSAYRSSQSAITGHPPA